MLPYKILSSFQRRKESKKFISVTCYFYSLKIINTVYCCSSTYNYFVSQNKYFIQILKACITNVSHHHLNDFTLHALQISYASRFYILSDLSHAGIVMHNTHSKVHAYCVRSNVNTG